MGTSFEMPRARLDAVPTAVTARISPVAYAVDEIASELKTGNAIEFGRRWWSASDDGIGRPTRMRFRVLGTAGQVRPRRSISPKRGRTTLACPDHATVDDDRRPTTDDRRPINDC
jgi:hypothetical protein